MDLGTRNIELSSINAAAFFGVNNQNLKHIKSFFPKLSITARGHRIVVKGEEELIDFFEVKFGLMVRHFEKFNLLTENNIDNLMLNEGEKLLNDDDGSETLVHGNGGVKIKARTVNQKSWLKPFVRTIWYFALVPQVRVKRTPQLPWRSKH